MSPLRTIDPDLFPGQQTFSVGEGRGTHKGCDYRRFRLAGPNTRHYGSIRMSPKRANPIDQARKKLLAAQAALENARAKRLTVIQDNERAIADVRSRAERRLQRATKHVERRALEVADAEARLAAAERDGSPASKT